MGYGNYDLDAHIAATRARAARAPDEVFKQGSCHPAMKPYGVRYRESRDSDVHPSSVGIVFALDVSGSMGEIPRQLATKTLPSFMKAVLTIMPDPQILFMAFGNAWADRSPLQVGQFESEAPLIDKWLEATHLEGGGGGLGESYDLAMYFAARHTAMDCLEKRKKKGYFFMTGDEVPFVGVNADKAREVIGAQLQADIPIHEMTAELLTSFHAFFLIPDPVRANTERCGPVWKVLLAERAIVLEQPEDTAVACAILIGITEGLLRDRADIERQLQQHLDRTGEACNRVVRAVLPYAEALARGPLAAPGALTPREDPGFRG